MSFARFIPPALRLCAGLLALPAAALAAETAQCDYSGFEKPCAAGGGEYRVLLPEGEGPFPAMVYLYGSGGRSVTIASHPVFEAAVAGRGYALIVPAAKEMTYAPGLRDTGWTLAAEREYRREDARGEGRDEAAFLGAVINDAARRFPIDRERVLLAGQSRGGFLIWEIACRRPDLATAYAVHAAGYLGALPESCAEPVRFLQTHGRADAVVPLTGRTPPPGYVGPSIPPMLETLGLMARANGCEEGPGEATPYLDFERQEWMGCAPGSRLDLMLHEGGHVMPPSWFRAVLDWFEEPLPEAEATGAVVRRIGEGLPVAEADPPEGDAETATAPVRAQPGARPAGRFKAPPAPGEKALGTPTLEELGFGAQ